MNVIFSEKSDISTGKVIDFLIYKGYTVIRHNGEDNKLNHFDFHNKVFSIEINSETNKYEVFNSSENISEKEIDEIASVWFRRPYKGIGDFNIDLEEYAGDIIPKAHLKRTVGEHYKVFKSFLVNKLAENKLGSFEVVSLNKPDVLLLAKKHGLNIPNTIITNSREKAISFLNEHKKIVIKALHEGLRYIAPEEEGYWVSNKIALIEDIDDIPKKFGVSLMQEYIEKRYELRIFYLNEKFYSSCIFSQNNKKTEVDFRNYDVSRPNRIVPYNLPKNIELKIIDLMKELGLNTGSIDLIKSKNDKYVFLEINPVGQYDFISVPCCYNLDLEIANYLTANE